MNLTQLAEYFEDQKITADILTTTPEETEFNRLARNSSYLRGIIRAEIDAARKATVGIPFQRLPHGEGLPLPRYETAGAAGFDLAAAQDATLYPGERAIVATGFNIALPAGHELQIRSRSGLSAKHGIVVLNAPGTIDEDYRGEIKVILLNTNLEGSDPFVIKRGDRIAQGVLAKVAKAVMVEVDTLNLTDRGAGGFGSTGIGTAT